MSAAGLQAEDELRRQANTLLEAPAWPAGGAGQIEARALVPKLKSLREFRLMRRLAERLLQLDPDDAPLRKLHLQGLIETGHLTAAIASAQSMIEQLPESHPEWAEFSGLQGRAWKQVALELHPSAVAARTRALRNAVQAYRVPWRKNPGNTWHAINLVAMLGFAAREGIAPADAGAEADAGAGAAAEAMKIARDVVARLHAMPAEKRDMWTEATLAEAHLALGELDAVERHLRAYLSDSQVSAFEVASTLRQFRDVWGLGASPDPRRRGIVDALATRLMQLPGASYRTPAATLQSAIAAAPSKEQLEAILGTAGTRSFKWWQTGLRTAASVGAVYSSIDKRHGTGFLVPARAFGVDSDEPLVLTNYHVVNEQGSGGAVRADAAWITFEAVDPDAQHRFAKVVWSSPVHRHDACLLQLEDPAAVQIKPIPIAPTLPVLEPDAKVYIIGHPGGGGLEFSFQDNELLDHDGPPATSRIEGVCRLHYRTPTEKGSSGSPVLNAGEWRLIGLHHAGGEMTRLTKPGTWPANEGISLQSIIAACKAELAGGDP